MENIRKSEIARARPGARATRNPPKNANFATASKAKQRQPEREGMCPPPAVARSKPKDSGSRQTPTLGVRANLGQRGLAGQQGPCVPSQRLQSNDALCQTPTTGKNTQNFPPTYRGKIHSSILEDACMVRNIRNNTLNSSNVRGRGKKRSRSGCEDAPPPARPDAPKPNRK